MLVMIRLQFQNITVKLFIVGLTLRECMNKKVRYKTKNTHTHTRSYFERHIKVRWYALKHVYFRFVMCSIYSIQSLIILTSLCKFNSRERRICSRCCFIYIFIWCGYGMVYVGMVYFSSERTAEMHKAIRYPIPKIENKFRRKPELGGRGARRERKGRENRMVVSVFRFLYERAVCLCLINNLWKRVFFSVGFWRNNFFISGALNSRCLVHSTLYQKIKSKSIAVL